MITYDSIYVNAQNRDIFSSRKIDQWLSGDRDDDGGDWGVTADAYEFLFAVMKMF